MFGINQFLELWRIKIMEIYSDVIVGGEVELIESKSIEETSKL
jgi:hypothetical protein